MAATAGDASGGGTHHDDIGIGAFIWSDPAMRKKRIRSCASTKDSLARSAS